MFAPVTKAVHVALRATPAPTIEARSRSALEAPRRPVYVEIPTDLLSAPRCRRRDVAAFAPRSRRPTPDAPTRCELLAARGSR